jgi:hypothetical protein
LTGRISLAIERRDNLVKSRETPGSREIKRSFHGGHSLMHGATMDMRKKPRASMGSTAGQDWRAWDVGRIKRAMYRVGARALRGNPRNLLTRWRTKKAPRRKASTGQAARLGGARIKRAGRSLKHVLSKIARVSLAAVANQAKTGLWRMSGHPAVQQAVRNNYFESLGLPKSMRPPKPNSVDSESKRKFRAVADAAR